MSRFGVECRSCGKKIPLGSVQVDEGDDNFAWRSKLLEKGWDTKDVPCPNPRCGGTNRYVPEDLILC